MKVLTTEEKIEYELMMKQIKFKKLKCWDMKPPEGFDKA